MFYRVARMAVLIIYRFLYSVRTEGTENLPTDTGYVVACNHRTNCDPIFVGISIKTTLTFMAKIELFRLPIIGRLFHWVGAFPVERGKGDTGAVEFAKQTVRQGKVLAMFPEGTRSTDGKLLRPKSGCALIAGATGACVVPVAICYNGNKLRFRDRVTVRFGKPITPQELNVNPAAPSSLKLASKLIMARISALLGPDGNGGTWEEGQDGKDGEYKQRTEGKK